MILKKNSFYNIPLFMFSNLLQTSLEIFFIFLNKDRFMCPSFGIFFLYRLYVKHVTRETRCRTTLGQRFMVSWENDPTKMSRSRRTSYTSWEIDYPLRLLLGLAARTDVSCMLLSVLVGGWKIYVCIHVCAYHVSNFARVSTYSLYIYNIKERASSG